MRQQHDETDTIRTRVKNLQAQVTPAAPSLKDSPSEGASAPSVHQPEIDLNQPVKEEEMESPAPHPPDI